MAARGFQPVLARLLADPGLIDELHGDPEAFAARHGTDAEVVDRLRAIDPARLRLTAALRQKKNRWHMRENFPASAALIERLAREDAVFAAAVERAGLFSGGSVDGFARRLAAFAETLPEEGPTLVLRELIAFELLWREVRERPAASAVPPGEPPERASAALQGEASGAAGPSAPRLAAGIRLARFAIPVAKAHRQITAGLPPTGIDPEPTCYVLSCDEGLQTRVSRIPPALHALLSLCDGTMGAREIAERLGFALSDVERALRTAREKGFLAAPRQEVRP
ncbi:hypothetical protein [Thermostaphylospora chromogena]|jgi:hypothetical protein|uniref:Uncharacterized protein n=1 Tax=Thermostaphylospora chromogena TaxID=35622 RepID=A0A1H1FUF1_9ACTN|nr:hypothetical protein [Thermostaphylospora chromogena]SDR04450.1 hypothetical protein SAMN04489764_3185 [Thermostaphylospora chromogena]